MGLAHNELMGRRKDERLLGDLLATCYNSFQHMPIFVGPCVAFGGFAVFYWLLPRFIPNNSTPISTLFRALYPLLAWFVGRRRHHGVDWR